MKKKILTLCLVRNDTHILLGMKKRGFGAGLWNGFGGKVEDGESIQDAAIREVQEESGVTVTKLIEAGILEFVFLTKEELLEVHVFEGKEVVGEATETEEMKPHWFPLNEIPYDDMWQDDKYWMPAFLDDKKFEGRFTFDANNLIVEKKLTY